MNKKELKKALDNAGVDPHYYSLDGLSGGPYEDAWILDNDSHRWLVYYFERGTKWNIYYFDKEDEACNYIFNKLISDPLTRIYNDKNH
jgi:hypothetical protein